MQTLYFAYAVWVCLRIHFSGAQYQLVNEYEYTASERYHLVFGVLPWAFKPVYGFVSDSAGDESALVLDRLAQAFLACLPMFGEKVAAGLTLASLCICFSTLDSIVVTHTKLYDKAVEHVLDSETFGSMIEQDFLASHTRRLVIIRYYAYLQRVRSYCLWSSGTSKSRSTKSLR